jgi:hypothetical protein
MNAAGAGGERGELVGEVVRLSVPTLADSSPLLRNFARIRRSAAESVCSKTPRAAPTTSTQTERGIDPEAVRGMKGPGRARPRGGRA